MKDYTLRTGCHCDHDDEPEYHSLADAVRGAEAPDGYALALRAAERAPEAAETPEQFEQRWKRERLAALAAEQRTRTEIEADREAAAEARPRILAELSSYAPPDGYQAGLKALRRKL